MVSQKIVFHIFKRQDPYPTFQIERKERQKIGKTDGNVATRWKT